MRGDVSQPEQQKKTKLLSAPRAAGGELLVFNSTQCWRSANASDTIIGTLHMSQRDGKKKKKKSNEKGGHASLN